MTREEFWFWFGVWTSILALVVAGTVTFTGIIPADWQPRVVTVAADLFAVNNVILTAAKYRGYIDAKSLAPSIVKLVLIALLPAVVLFALLTTRAYAIDLPPKKAPAPDWTAMFKGYPYGSSGLFVGLYTEGGSAGVTGSVAGVGSNSLTSTQAGVGFTLGWAWGQATSPIAYTVESDFGWTNFNGSNAGFSLTGPLSFEQRFVLFTPLSNITSRLPGFPNLGTVPPFQALPTGVTASNIQSGLMVGLDEFDISPNFPGLKSNMEWRVAPMIGLVAMEQLSDGTALRAWVKTIFPADKSVCVGPIQNACANVGQQIKVGAGVYW